MSHYTSVLKLLANGLYYLFQALWKPENRKPCLDIPWPAYIGGPAGRAPGMEAVPIATGWLSLGPSGAPPRRESERMPSAGPQRF